MRHGCILKPHEGGWGTNVWRNSGGWEACHEAVMDSWEGQSWLVIESRVSLQSYWVRPATCCVFNGQTRQSLLSDAELRTAVWAKFSSKTHKTPQALLEDTGYPKHAPLLIWTLGTHFKHWLLPTLPTDSDLQPQWECMDRHIKHWEGIEIMALRT